MKNLCVAILLSGLLAPLAAQAQAAVTTVEQSQAYITESQPRIFYGGGMGLGFGDVDYYEFWPLIGVHLTNQLGVGIQFMYRHRDDKRYQQTLSTDDYGATLFGRYRLPGPYFLQAQYEYINYEYYRTTITGLKTERSDFSSFMAGGGVSQALGRNTSAYATILYNFSYNQSDSPYDYPWIVRFGVGVGF